METSGRWLKIPDPFNPRRLAFKFDPERLVIELAKGDRTVEIDLSHHVARHRQKIDSPSPQ